MGTHTVSCRTKRSLTVRAVVHRGLAAQELTTILAKLDFAFSRTRIPGWQAGYPARVWACGRGVSCVSCIEETSQPQCATLQYRIVSGHAFVVVCLAGELHLIPTVVASFHCVGATMSAKRRPST